MNKIVNHLSLTGLQSVRPMYLYFTKFQEMICSVVQGWTISKTRI